MTLQPTAFEDASNHYILFNASTSANTLWQLVSRAKFGRDDSWQLDKTFHSMTDARIQAHLTNRFGTLVAN